MFRAAMSGVAPDEFDSLCIKQFAGWFTNYVHTHNDLVSEEGLLYHLSYGPKSRARTWPAYFINGYNFHIQEYGMGKATMNSDDFYGLLDEIIQLEYPGPIMHVVLFKCTWFDPVKGMRVDSKFNLVEVNHRSKYPKYEPFILAQQAIQVYYASYPSLKRDKADWWAACKMKARKKIDIRWKDTAYQQEIVLHTAEPQTYEIPDLRDPHGVLIDVDESETRESDWLIGHEDEDEEFQTEDDEDTDLADEYDDHSDNEDTEDEDENDEDEDNNAF